MQEDEVFERVTVPKVPAVELVRRVESELRPAYIAPNLRAWNFMGESEGKTFEVLKWRPGCTVVPAKEVRRYMSGMGFEGNTAAFICWLIEHNPEGWFATLPEDDALFRIGNVIFTEFYFRAGETCGIFLCADPYGFWSEDWSFLGFREVRA